MSETFDLYQFYGEVSFFGSFSEDALFFLAHFFAPMTIVAWRTGRIVVLTTGTGRIDPLNLKKCIIGFLAFLKDTFLSFLFF